MAVSGIFFRWSEVVDGGAVRGQMGSFSGGAEIRTRKTISYGARRLRDGGGFKGTLGPASRRGPSSSSPDVTGEPALRLVRG